MQHILRLAEPVLGFEKPPEYCANSAVKRLSSE